MHKFEPGAMLLGRYKILDVRNGGMGQVAICGEQTSSGEARVAIKSIRADLLQETGARARFEKEAGAWMAVGRAPWGFILPLEQVITDGGSLLLVMKYCSNGSLAERMARGGLGVGQVLELATQLLLGIHTLHVDLGLVHRDLKPANVLLDADGRVQISDLGLVKGDTTHLAGQGPHGVAPGATQLGQFLGTVGYAAPEQVRGSSEVDGRVDLWAFGVIVYELLMGKRPFPVRSAAEYYRAASTSPPPELDDLARRSSGIVRQIVARCLAPDPRKRYQLVGELIAAWDEAVRMEFSPKLGLFKRDQRIVLPKDSLAAAPWTWQFFPERVRGRETLIGFDIGAAAGVQEARDFYRLDRHAEAIDAAAKTLGRHDDPRSNVVKLLAGELPQRSVLERADVGDSLRSRLVPSRDMALEALGWSLRALVALVEANPNDRRSLDMLLKLSERIAASKLDDHDVRVLAAQGYMLAGQFEVAERIGRKVLEGEPLHVPGGWVVFQAVRRAGRAEEARSLAKALVAAYVRRTEAQYHALAVRLAYSAEDWELVAKIGMDAVARVPKDIEVLALVASGFLCGGRREDARRCYERMRQIAPQSHFTLQMARAFAT